MENPIPPQTPKNHLEPIWQGTVKALQTLLILAKIVIPVTFVLVALQQLGWLERVAGLFSPFLNLFGLPGEAALPLLLGFFVNIYAAMGAIAVLQLSPREITVIALMILTCHALLMESPVLKFTGLPPVTSVLLRIGGAFFFGFLLNLAYILLGG
ncbi:nucleoside recognition domain-containing protein [Dethiobacter alkaliphilus]|uniref:nucleoside recognition domain-containing protein n=1 Tax=Dethiobacter alkaliphilus TaxID=427926 RepID=UPI002226D04B|nr:nucleoside recognition domain-containing protein [Dethiobacter alkaliphilus]MCW3490949.1 nucleoside recognition protein [Dethiobacter alkaliphilus]